MIRVIYLKKNFLLKSFNVDFFTFLNKISSPKNGGKGCLGESKIYKTCSIQV